MTGGSVLDGGTLPPWLLLPVSEPSLGLRVGGGGGRGVVGGGLNKIILMFVWLFGKP
jgi:hypothetical protein